MNRLYRIDHILYTLYHILLPLCLVYIVRLEIGGDSSSDEVVGDGEGERNTQLGRHQGVRDYLMDTNITEHMLSTQPSCPVCTSDFMLNEPAVLLPCLHVFHEECVVLWLREKHNCPVCRLDLAS